MLRKLRALLHSFDDKPVTLSAILGRDAPSRTLIEFGEKHLSNCKGLVIVWQDSKGDVEVMSSDNVDEVIVAGLLSLANGMVTNGKEVDMVKYQEALLASIHQEEEANG